MPFAERDNVDHPVSLYAVRNIGEYMSGPGLESFAIACGEVLRGVRWRSRGWRQGLSLRNLPLRGFAPTSHQRVDFFGKLADQRTGPGENEGEHLDRSASPDRSMNCAPALRTGESVVSFVPAAAS